MSSKKAAEEISHGKCCGINWMLESRENLPGQIVWNEVDESKPPGGVSRWVKRLTREEIGGEILREIGQAVGRKGDRS